MKRALFIVLALIALRSEAQTPVCIGAGCTVGAAQFTSTAQNDADGLRAKLIDNAAVCLSHGLTLGCTQAQLNALPNCGLGVCGTIYALTGAGTAQYAMDRMTSCYFAGLAAKVSSAQANAAAGLMVQNGSATATNTECANAVGGTLGNGCSYAQIACRALSNGTSSTCVPQQ